MKSMKKRFIDAAAAVCAAIVLTASCAREEHPDLPAGGGSGTVFRLEKSAYDGASTRASGASGSGNETGRYDRLYHYIVDGRGYVVENLKSFYDPEADGRVQSAEIVVTASDGGSEVYTVRRLNWGLPVVNINGTWWCKYNLRGNVKDFGDQITIASDPADASSLAEYLTTCTDEEFAEILGDQYQGGRQDGLKLTAVDGSLLYSGFDPSSSGDFGLLDPEYMAPDGYSIPDYQDYRFFTWNENANLGYGPDGFNNLLGQRITYTITPREAVVGGVEYGPVHIYDFVYEGAHWVMAGFGHQYNATDIAPMSLLFATSGTGGKTWMLEGYSKSDGRGNWFKYSAQNARKTRLIRCVKTPVEYIY